MTYEQRKEELLVQSQVIGKLLLNRDMRVIDALNSLAKIVATLEQLNIEKDYNDSLKDCVE